MSRVEQFLAYADPGSGLLIWQGLLAAFFGSLFYLRRILRRLKKGANTRAEQRGSAFGTAPRRNLERIFSIQQERVVNRDNTVQIGNQVLQIDQTRWRATLAGCKVIVYEHLDGTVSIGLGPHTVARFAADGASRGARPCSAGDCDLTDTAIENANTAAKPATHFFIVLLLGPSSLAELNNPVHGKAYITFTKALQFSGGVGSIGDPCAACN